MHLYRNCRKKIHFLSEIQCKPMLKENPCFNIVCKDGQHVISTLKDFLKITVFNMLNSNNQFDFLLKTSEKSCTVLNCPLSFKRSFITYQIPVCILFVKHIVG